MNSRREKTGSEASLGGDSLGEGTRIHYQISGKQDFPLS